MVAKRHSLWKRARGRRRSLWKRARVVAKRRSLWERGRGRKRSLCKGDGKEAQPLGKGQGEGRRKPIVVVDWHKTLSLKDGVPSRHLAALEALLEVAQVHILSYVSSWKRAREVARRRRRCAAPPRCQGCTPAGTAPGGTAKLPGASTWGLALSLMTMQRSSRSAMPEASSRWQSAAGGRAMARRRLCKRPKRSGVEVALEKAWMESLEKDCKYALEKAAVRDPLEKGQGMSLEKDKGSALEKACMPTPLEKGDRIQEDRAQHRPESQSVQEKCALELLF